MKFTCKQSRGSSNTLYCTNLPSRIIRNFPFCERSTTVDPSRALSVSFSIPPSTSKSSCGHRYSNSCKGKTQRVPLQCCETNRLGWKSIKLRISSTQWQQCTWLNFLLLTFHIFNFNNSSTENSVHITFGLDRKYKQINIT